MLKWQGVKNAQPLQPCYAGNSIFCLKPSSMVYGDSPSEKRTSLLAEFIIPGRREALNFTRIVNRISLYIPAAKVMEVILVHYKTRSCREIVIQLEGNRIFSNSSYFFRLPFLYSSSSLTKRMERYVWCKRLLGFTHMEMHLFPCWLVVYRPTTWKFSLAVKEKKYTFKKCCILFFNSPTNRLSEL